MTTANATKPRRGPHTRQQVGDLPAHGVSDSIMSFQYGLRARERAAVDRALKIVGSVLRRNEAMSSPELVKQYLNLHLAGEPVEKFAVLHLDVQNRSIAFDIMFTGTLTQASVYPREVVLAALAHRSAAVILAHNHPSGKVQPSAADRSLTATLQTALALIDVRVLDHIIVAPGAALSMAERGLI